jgi:hypothetical protein
MARRIEELCTALAACVTALEAQIAELQSIRSLKLGHKPQGMSADWPPSLHKPMDVSTLFADAFSANSCMELDPSN